MSHFPDKLRTRIAPTPSGLLHPGNGLSFLMTWVLARAGGGEVLLRIDDLDAVRVRPEYIADIFETLGWLGLDYDEGPSGPDDFDRHFSQRHRLPLYHALLDELRAQGLLYACTCSRSTVRTASDSGVYVGTCRLMGRPFDAPDTAWRLALPPDAAGQWAEWPSGRGELAVAQGMNDFVVRQKSGLPAYQISSLADDLHWGINFIVRGADLLPSTAAQMYLATLLQRTAFTHAVCWHHPLITDADGEKLSKSKGAGSLQDLRRQGQTPHWLYALAARHLGLPAVAGETLDALVAAAKRRGDEVGSL